MRLTRQAPALLASLLLAACATAPGPGAPGAETSAEPSAPRTPAFRLGDVEGKTPAAVDRLLGAPALTRREGAGEFRRYALAECALLVIFYPDEAGASTAKAVEAAALTSDAPKPDLKDCLAAGAPAAKP